MTNFLPGAKIYQVLGCVVGMCLTISIVSCGGNQPVNPPNNFKEKNPTNQIESCDPVNDTLYQNFHSNMKEADYKKELENFQKNTRGILFEDKEITFSIKGTFNNCLSKLELRSSVEFGIDNESNAKEFKCFSFIKDELEKKYGPLSLSEKTKENHLESFAGPDRAIAMIYNSVLHNKNTPQWVLDYAHFGTGSDIDSLGNIKSKKCSVYSNGNQDVYPPITKEDINNEISLDIEILNSAEYTSYFNNDKSVELILVTSYFTHQDGYFSKKINTTTTKVIINYYSNKYWSELEMQKKEAEKNKNLEKLKRDSLMKTNQDRL